MKTEEHDISRDFQRFLNSAATASVIELDVHRPMRHAVPLLSVKLAL